MVQAVVDLREHADRVLTIIKGKFGFKNKSDAVNYIIEKYEEELLEPELRPEYKDKLANIIRGKHLSRSAFEKEVQ
ncbi:antitoxin [Nanoarchaeota archaeon]